jgi:hypothetical protein
MKYIVALIAVFISTSVMAQVTASEAPKDHRNFVSIEYAPDSNHLSNDDAPVGGYNEDNDIVIVKIGREYDWKTDWRYSLSAGFTTFDNSYNERSNGIGIGAEAHYILNRNFSLYGGGDFGFVSGYDGNVDDGYVIFNEYIPFFVLNGGVEYEFKGHLPTLRGGVKYVPASIVGSDDVVALSVGTRVKF